MPVKPHSVIGGVFSEVAGSSVWLIHGTTLGLGCQDYGCVITKSVHTDNFGTALVSPNSLDRI